MPFALNTFYRKTSTRRGQLPVGTIVKCLFAGQGGGLLAQYVDGDCAFITVFGPSGQTGSSLPSGIKNTFASKRPTSSKGISTE